MKVLPSESQLITFGQQLQGESLYTLKQKKIFRVSVVSGGLEVIPQTGKTRTLSHTDVANTLAELKRSGSFHPADYADITFNASYVLALVHLWQNQQA